MATFVLIIQILFYLVLCAGIIAQRRGLYHWHDRLQAPVVVLNIFFIIFVMIPSFRSIVLNELPDGLRQIPTSVTAIHAGLGSVAQILAIYCLLAGFKILPRKIGVLRYWMWSTFGMWTLTILFGIGVYLFFYTSIFATAGGDQAAFVAEHDADVAGEEAAPAAGDAQQSPDLVEEHAEEVAAPETPAEETETEAAPTTEIIAEHDAEEAAPEATEPPATEAAAETEATAENTAAATEEAIPDEHAEELAGAAEPGTAAESIVYEWQLLRPVNEGPSPRYEHAMQYSPATNQLFVVGGHNGEQVFDDTWALDLETLSWTFLADESKSPTAPVLYSSVMIVDDEARNLYLAAGQNQNGQVTNEVWRLDLASEVWQNITDSAGPGPTPRYGGPGGNIGGNLVLTHGFGTTRYDDTWQLNTVSGQWENITPSGTLPLGRCLFAATPGAGNLVIHGGCSTPDGPCYRDDTWILDTEANVWREVLSDLKPEGRQHHTLVEAEAGSGQVILYGGQDASGAARDDLWMLNLETGVWQRIAASSGLPRYNHAAVWIPDQGMLIFGGRNSEGALNDVWLLRLQLVAPAAPATQPAVEPTEPAPTAEPAEPAPTVEPVSEHDGG